MVRIVTISCHLQKNSLAGIIYRWGDKLAQFEIYRIPENGSVTFSIRVPNVINGHLDELSKHVNIPKNKIINMMIEYCFSNMVIKDFESFGLIGEIEINKSKE